MKRIYYSIIVVLAVFTLLFCGSSFLDSGYSYAAVSDQGHIGYTYLCDENGNKQADEYGYYKTVSDTVLWTVEDDILSFSVDGDVYNVDQYINGFIDDSSSQDYPWSQYKDQIKTVIIGKGIYTIPMWAFKSFGNLESIVIYKQLHNVHYGAFAYCNNFGTVFYEGSAANWNSISINRGKLNGQQGIDFNKRLVNAVIHYNSLDHDWISVGKLKEETCTESGEESFKCLVCGETKTETISPLGHVYGDWIVTKKATTTATGSREKVCEHCRHKVAEAIPKVKPPTGKVTILNTVANSAKKTNDVIWDKSSVTGANGYIIEWRAKGASKWASTKVGNVTRGVTSGLTIGGLYEIRVTPYKAASATSAEVIGTPSNIVYRYFFTTQKIRLASNSKGTFTMSWAKESKATSYQVLYTTNSNGSGAAQNIKSVGASATSITVKDIKVNGIVQKLKSGTTYYVQVREVRTVGGKNYIGNISCPVAVKVK